MRLDLHRTSPLSSSSSLYKACRVSSEGVKAELEPGAFDPPVLGACNEGWGDLLGFAHRGR